jgi:LacI family transcriptional regulator
MRQPNAHTARITSRATLADVARLAEVSLGSASRALSAPNQVKARTLARVRHAVEQLGYVRNGAAQALASRRTRTIAAIYPTLGNPIFAVSINSLQQTLWSFGYQLLVASHEYKPEREIEVLRAIVERGADGIVLVGTEHSDSVFALARQYGLPYVLTWASANETRGPQCVGFSYYDAAYRMASLVIEYGHTEIALCGGLALGNERVRARIAGTRAAMEASGLSLRPEWIIEQPFSFEGGRQAIRQIMNNSGRPSVLICGTDLHAIGAIDECRDRQIGVPEELSVTGSDDIEVAALLGVTTVRVPTVTIGVRAATRIVGLIEGHEISDDGALETSIVVRDSLGKVDASQRDNGVRKQRHSTFSIKKSRRNA